MFLEKVKKVPKDYNIFIDWAGEVGFNPTGKKIAENDLYSILVRANSKTPENIIKFSELEERIDPWYYHPNYKRIEQSLMKSIFPLKPLSELIEFSEDFVDKKGNPEDILTYIETNDVDLIKGRINPDTQLPRGKLPNRAKYILKENDILIPNARDCVRGIAMANDKQEGYIVTNRFFVVRHIKDVVHLKYLYYLLKQPEVLILLKKQASGEINPSINPKKLKFVKVPVPKKLEEQLLIVNKIEENENRIKKMKDEIKKYRNGISVQIRGDILPLKEASERAKKLGSEFISFIYT